MEEAMEQLWITLPALAPDYSGVCSAMFDLGGICVIHDASGCTGNYTGYDEPRWYGSSSKIFCSGLREIDAVLGRDDKLIDNVLKAGEVINPTMYTVIGSPVPMAIGSDMKGIAYEIEERTGIPSFGFDTNGLGLYNKGVSMAMCELIRRFTKKAKKRFQEESTF
jgi:nitrogenase molybdenum-iron protein alpha/beta subunit